MIARERERTRCSWFEKLVHTLTLRAAGAVLALGILSCTSGAAVATTVVSIDLDDGFVDDVQAASMLEARGMRATVFPISSRLGRPGYMTVDQVRSLQAAGHEIGSHTVSHADLTKLPPDEAQREICDSREILLRSGFDVQSFAYPYGALTPALERTAAACGYNSARSVGPLSAALPAEAIPPSDPYAIRTRASIQVSNSLADIEDGVLAAEATGGWLHLIFHRICDDACDAYSISPANFGALLDWLASRQPLGTVVRTQREVIGGMSQPGVPGPPPTPRTTPNLLLNPSLEELDATGAPVCWQRLSWGSNTPTWTTVTPAYDGANAQAVEVGSYADGGVRLVPTLDLGHCAPPATPGHAYQVTGFYKSSGSPVWVLLYRDDLGQWRWWTQSAALDATSTWTQSSFTTPPLPAGASAIGFGLSLYGTGDLTVDDFTLLDAGLAPATVALTSPTNASFVRGSATLTATAPSPSVSR